MAKPKKSMPVGDPNDMAEQAKPKIGTWWPTQGVSDEVACAIRDLHKFLAANLSAASKRDLDKGLKQLKDDLVKEMGERVDPSRIQKLTNDLKTNAQALEKAVTENQSNQTKEREKQYVTGIR